MECGHCIYCSTEYPYKLGTTENSSQFVVLELHAVNLTDSRLLMIWRDITEQHRKKEQSLTTLSSTAPSLRDIRILIIDDNEEACDIAKLCLELSGAKVKVATSARQGMATITDFAPQVLVVDIQMPEQDGYSFIRQVRTMEASHIAQTPAIAFTANALDSDRKQALLAGFQLHIPKPIDIDELTAAVSLVAPNPNSELVKNS